MLKILDTFKLPEEPKVIEAFDPATRRQRKAIDRGLIMSVMEGEDELPRGVYAATSITAKSGEKIHFVLNRWFEFDAKLELAAK